MKNDFYVASKEKSEPKRFGFLLFGAGNRT